MAFFKLKNFFCTIYFDHIFPSTNFSPNLFHYYLPTHQIFSLKKKKSKRPIRQKKVPKQNEMKQKVHKNTTQFIFGWSTIPEHGACPVVWLIHPLYWRTDLPFTRGYQLQRASWLAVRALSASLSGLEPVQLLCTLQCLEFVCAVSPVMSGVIHHLWFILSSHLLFSTNYWFMRGRVWWKHPIYY